MEKRDTRPMFLMVRPTLYLDIAATLELGLGAIQPTESPSYFYRTEPTPLS